MYHCIFWIISIDSNNPIHVWLLWGRRVPGRTIYRIKTPFPIPDVYTTKTKWKWKIVMAQRDNLRKRIVDYLQQSEGKTRSLKEIVHTVGKDKKCINQILYALKRDNALTQVNRQPPVWKLVNRDLALKTRLWAQNTRGKPRISSPKKFQRHMYRVIWFIFSM